MLTFWPDWSVRVKSGVGCGGSSSPPAKRPLPPVTVTEAAAPCSCSWPPPPPQAEAASAASRARANGARRISPESTRRGRRSVCRTGLRVRTPDHLRGCSRPGDVQSAPDNTVELDLDTVRGRDPGPVRGPGGGVAREREVGQSWFAAEVEELDGLADGQERRTVVCTKNWGDALVAGWDLRRREGVSVRALEPLSVYDDRERPVGPELRVRDAAVRGEDDPVADENLIADRVCDLVAARVCDRATRQAPRRPADLQVEADPTPPAPGHTLRVVRPDDDAEKRAIAAQLLVRQRQVSDAEGMEAVLRAGAEPVGDPRAHRRRPEEAVAAEVGDRPLAASREADDPDLAGLRVGEGQCSVEDAFRPAGGCIRLWLRARKPARRRLNGDGRRRNPFRTRVPAYRVGCGEPADDDHGADYEECQKVPGLQDIAAIMRAFSWFRTKQSPKKQTSRGLTTTSGLKVRTAS